MVKGHTILSSTVLKLYCFLSFVASGTVLLKLQILHINIIQDLQLVLSIYRSVFHPPLGFHSALIAQIKFYHIQKMFKVNKRMFFLLIITLYNKEFRSMSNYKY